MLVVAVVGSPNAGGRTRVAVDAMLRGAAAEGARTQVIESAAYTDDGRGLRDDMRELAELHGRALVELADAVRRSKWLRELRPLI